MRAEGRAGPPSRFLSALFWEFVQNLPLVAGLLLGLDAWQAGTRGLAVACMAGGSAAGSLIIWATESRMVEGHQEPLRAVLANVVVMAVLMFVVVLYLAAAWSRWWTDVLAGVVVGIGLGVAQDLAAGSSIGLRHSAAFALAFALGLVGVRLLVAALPLALAVLAVTLVVTVAITLLDYGPAIAARDGTSSR